MKQSKLFGASRRASFKAGVALSGLGLSLAMAGPAHAAEEDDDNIIVVTGTLVRGIEPTGTNVVGVSAEEIKSSSASTVSELLTEVPQFGAFNSFNTLSGGGNFVTTNRPNLRNLPGFTTTGTSATLMLVDGHRVVGMGISSTTPDADFVPTGILERVDIVPDGGSALYGSDAVAGVVNFITRKSMNGLEADFRYGFGKNGYNTIDGNLTVGKEWDDGGIIVSYSYSHTDQIFGRDSGYVFTPLNVIDGLQIRDINCPMPNLQVSPFPGGPTTLYSALDPTAANTANICDLSADGGIFPQQDRHSVYAGVNQQLTDWLEVDVRGFYYHKKTQFSLGQFDGVARLGPAFLAPFGFANSPFDVSLTGSPAETKTVSFALGRDNIERQTVTLDAWGITPTFTADLGSSWQARALIGYSESKSTSINPRINDGAIPGLVNSGMFNPFNPTGASPTTIAALTNQETFGQSKQSQFNARLIADGDLFELPGGASKLAVGVEYIDETFDTQRGTVLTVDRLTLPLVKQSRNVTSVFGEFVAPLFKTDGGMSLTVSASGRYDHYSDVGGTFNPKLGATFKPVDWVSIRGAWGESFVAPSMSDGFLADPTNINFASGAIVNFLLPPALIAANGLPPIGGNQQVLFVLGSSPGLQPQTAETWSIGADIQPPFAPGLNLSATYYNLTYQNIISLVPFVGAGAETLLANFQGIAFIRNPTQAQIDNIVAQAGTNVVGTGCPTQPACIYAIEDVRKQNLGGFKQDGIDFIVDYRRQTGFGGIDLNVNGTYVLNRKTSPVAGTTFVDDAPTSKFQVRTSVGADIGKLRAQAAWNFRKGYNLNFPVGLNNQMSVGSFSTVDLFFEYDFEDSIVGQELALTVTVNNVFDQAPPLSEGGRLVLAQRGFENGNTVGRVIQVGLRTKF